MQIPDRTISLVETVRGWNGVRVMVGREISLHAHTHTHTISLSFSFSFIHSPSPSIFRSEREGVGASLIIGLNVASADSDESSGFECSLQYVTVIVAGQLTN